MGNFIQEGIATPCPSIPFFWVQPGQEGGMILFNSTYWATKKNTIKNIIYRINNCVRRRRTLPNRHVTAGCYVISRFSVYVAFASLSCFSVYVAFASLSCFSVYVAFASLSCFSVYVAFASLSCFSVYVAFPSLSCFSVYVAFASLSCGDLNRKNSCMWHYCSFCG